MVSTPAGTRPVVQASGLCKRFGARPAVTDLSFAVAPGEIVGLLGPNGAGKTTTIRMLLDIIRPDAGHVALFGAASSAQARDRIGYLPEERGLYRNLPILPNLRYLAALKGVPPGRAEQRAQALLARLGLAPHQDKRTQQLSRGLGQLAQFAATLIHEPAFVVLDEPFSGLDPLNARLMKAVVTELRDAGVAFLLSTHQMPDVEALCDRILLLDGGELVLAGELAELKQRFAAHELFVVSDQATAPLPGVLAARPSGSGHILQLAAGHPVEAVIGELLRRGARLTHVEPVEPSIEQIFLQVVRRRHD